VNGWEYQQVSAAAPLVELNALGADDWEVVGPRTLIEQVGLVRTEEHVLLLRQPVQPAGQVTGD
jgi:hypothetical protein